MKSMQKEDGSARFLFSIMQPEPILIFEVLSQVIGIGMGEDSQIRLKRIRQRVLANDFIPISYDPFLQLAKHATLSFISQKTIMR